MYNSFISLFNLLFFLLEIEIIRELYERGNATKPSNNRELMKLYKHMNNFRRVDGTINYMLVGVGMFGSYESTSHPSSDNGSFFLALS